MKNIHGYEVSAETQRNRDKRIKQEWLQRIEDNREKWIEKMGKERNEDIEIFYSHSPLGDSIRKAQIRLDKMREYDVSCERWKKEEKRINTFIIFFSIIGVSGLLWTSLIFLFSLGN